MTASSENPSAQATEIGKGRFKALVIAVGHPKRDYVQRTEELHDKPFWGYVTKKRAQAGYGDDDG